MFFIASLGHAEDAIIANGDFSRGLEAWVPGWKAEEFFQSQANADFFVRYSREKDQAPEVSATLKQEIEIPSDCFFELSIDYQTDSVLAPMIWITDTSKKKKPIRMIPLPNSPERSVFRTRLNIGKQSDPVTLQLCPGTRSENLLKNHAHPNSTHSGQVDFHSISINPSSFSEPEVARINGGFRTETVVYKTVGDLELVLMLDLPENPPTEKMPVAFWVHGGGWVNGSPKDLVWRTSQLAPRGIVNARVQYRLIKQGGAFPGTFHDLLDAMQWLRDHADEYNIDLSRLVIAGGSAGGQLSSILAQKTPECIGYIGMCGLYNTVDIGNGRFGRSKKFMLDDPQVVKSASAIHNIRKNPPAALLIHGKADATIDYMQAVYFAEELRKHGGKAETLILEGTGHDFGYPYAVNQAIDRFLSSLGFPKEPLK